MRTLLTLLLFTLLGTCARAQKSMRQLLLDSLHQEMTALAAQDQLPGFAVALVDANGPVYEAGFGYANLAEKEAFTEHTTQNIGSISKTFIGIALLQAEREGLLSLDDPVNKHLPFRVIHPRYPNQPILLRHLTQHTAGINDDKNYDYAYSLLEPMTVSKDEISKGEYREMLETSQNKAYDLGAYLQRFFTPGGRFYHKKNFTKRAPGERYQYSNVGAALAAFALETASGQSFAEWTRERIFRPLGMNNTAWHPDEVDQKITHYFGNRKPMPNYLLATYPDGGVWTSVHQLGQYCTATIAGMQKGNDVLPREDYLRLLQNHVNTPKAGETYGNFWERISSDLYGHSGGDPGIVTLMYISEENGYGHVVFTSGTPSGENFYNKALIPLIRYGRKLAAL